MPMKADSVVATLGPAGTDSECEARKHFSNVLLLPSFTAAVDHASQTGGYALVPAGYIQYHDGKIADTWVDLHFRILGRMQIMAVWESPTKKMCLAINRDRVVDRESIQSVALHPATAVFAKQLCAAAKVTFVNAKPLAVRAAARGAVDACIGSVDLVSNTLLEPVDFFSPTMVWCLYGPSDHLPDREDEKAK